MIDELKIKSKILIFQRMSWREFEGFKFLPKQNLEKITGTRKLWVSDFQTTRISVWSGKYGHIQKLCCFFSRNWFRTNKK